MLIFLKLYSDSVRGASDGNIASRSHILDTLIIRIRISQHPHALLPCFATMLTKMKYTSEAKPSSYSYRTWRMRNMCSHQWKARFIFRSICHKKLHDRLGPPGTVLTEFFRKRGASGGSAEDTNAQGIHHVCIFPFV